MKKSKVVYISSPYTLGNQADNVRNQIIAAEILRGMGYLPFVPLLSHFWHFMLPHPYDYWMKMDLEWLEHVDIVLRLPGKSKGADIECECAKELGIPVYYSICELGECDANT